MMLSRAPVLSWRRFVLPLLVVLVTLHGGLLRVEALHARYGWMDRPLWVAAVESRAVPLASRLRPAGVFWYHVDRPYVGGDPVNYVRFAREMRSFYQAHVREPVFLALTRGVLELMGDKDVALSYTSLIASTLAIPATYLLGSLCSPAVGLAAAAALAIEFDAISWAPEGWRDDTFMLFVTLAAWALIRLRRDPTPASVATAGVAGALACLTRLSALTFVFPAFLYAGARNEMPPAPAARRVGVAALLTIALVLPYLVNCARATGDPFFAVNYHTRYYRATEQLPVEGSGGALGYLLPKFASRPLDSIDTAFIGLFVHPYANKWKGFTPWLPALGRVLFWCGAIGLVLATATRDGRLLLLIVLTSLIPYAMTWRIGGGGEWRFTQHAYPLYLVAAFGAVAAAVALVRAVAARRGSALDLLRSSRRAALVALAVAAGVAWYTYIPFLIFRETLARGEPASITSGDRDRAFFSGTWSRPESAGNVVVRASLGERASVRLAIPRGGTSHRITVRIDPAETAEAALQPSVTVYFNGRPVARLHLSRDEGRVGTYRFMVTPGLTDRRVSRIDFVASHTVPAADAGPRFSWLPATTPVAFRLWYVRVEPIAAEATE